MTGWRFQIMQCWPRIGGRGRVAVVGILLLVGCDRPGGPASRTPAQQQQSARTYVIGMSQCNLGEPWRVQMNADIRAAAQKHPELRVIFKDAQNDTLRQRAHVEEFINAKVDLLIISPKEAAPLTEPVARAMAAGIPVIVLDRAVLGEDIPLVTTRPWPAGGKPSTIVAVEHGTIRVLREGAVARAQLAAWGDVV